MRDVKINCIDNEFVLSLFKDDDAHEYVGERIYNCFNEEYNSFREIGRGLEFCFNSCETDEERAMVNLVVCMLTGSTIQSIFDVEYDQWRG